MAYQATHPVEVGTFGRFRFGGRFIVETWIALEDLSAEFCGGLWIGIYNPWNILDWAKTYGLLKPDEIKVFEAALS